MTADPDPDPDLAAAVRALGERLDGLRTEMSRGDADLARQLAAVRDAAAQVAVVLAAHRGQLAALRRRVDDAGLDSMADRFGQLEQTIRDVLDAAAPRGPAAPRWDGIDAARRQQQLAALREWVDGVLRPGYCADGCYTLADCWAQHEVALWELGTAAVWWRHIYGRARPDTQLALEFHDRWLPGAMRRVAEATRHCAMGHGGGL